MNEYVVFVCPSNACIVAVSKYMQKKFNKVHYIYTYVFQYM